MSRVLRDFFQLPLTIRLDSLQAIELMFEPSLIGGLFRVGQPVLQKEHRVRAALVS